MKLCDECNGTGYLLDQEYGFADAPDDWRYVQRCDTCQEYDGDDDAAQAAADDGHGDAVAYWYPRSQSDSPGDYAIHVCQ